MNTLQFLVDYGAWVLFAVIFLEQAGFPLPALPLLVAAGALVGSGKMSVTVAVLVPLLAAIPPDLFWYYLGRRKGGRILGLLCKISLEPDSCVRSSENVFRRHGMSTLLLAKFIPGLSTIAPPLAGIIGMSISSFILYDAAGTFLWLIVSEGVGALFSNQLESILALFDQAGGWLLAIVLGGIAIFIGYKFYRRQQILREHRMAKISVDELKAMMDAGQPVMIADVRNPLSRETDPEAIPGAIHMLFEELDQRHHDLLKNQEVVLYCTCPNDISSARTALKLKRQGVQRVRPLQGGLDAWRERRFPTERVEHRTDPQHRS
ncbi:MAG TPA: DedA family protein/thiosulfate sulfurtransferase GlpE [Nitrospira sp.]|nr:DedA family protein/thiosulfate sulfurtransferase GlpE [Nitrospira sp.]